MTQFETVTCLECDHEHDCPIIRGEYPSDDYCEAPEVCENCGASFDDAISVNDGRRSERRQMGITY